MERHVKERLIGAAVLVAAAVILIPEMLSGPDRSVQSVPEAQATTGSMKTYTIDLSRPPTGTVPASTNIPDQAPPQEMPPVASSAATDEESPDSDTGAMPAGDQLVTSNEQQAAQRIPAEAAPSQTRADPPTPSSKPAAAPAPEERPVVSQPRPATTAWAVQVGSFASQATAAKLAKDLRSDGFESFVMPVKSGTSTLYRVRIGPMQDRDTATRLLTRIKVRAPGAAVVRHP